MSSQVVIQFMPRDIAQLLKPLESGLIVSCQAPADSPLNHPTIIAAIAESVVAQNAVAVRIDTPERVTAVRQRISAPILGLWKQKIPGYEVYITPRFEQAQALAEAGADFIAIDATLRDRPEPIEILIQRIHQELGKLVVADIDSLESAIAAIQAGADMIATTMYGFTPATEGFSPPAFDLLAEILEKSNVPVICEGKVNSPELARQAIDLGAYAVVVGTAITGIEAHVQAFDAALRKKIPALLIERNDTYHFALFTQEHPSYRNYVRSKLRQYNPETTSANGYFDQSALRGLPIEIFLLDDRDKVKAGLVSLTRWNWLLIEALWVEESIRRQGFASQLMHLAEQEAKRRGCTEALLDTFSFQAKEFYEKLGYEMFAQVDDYPSGYSFFQLKKEL
ncbi:putative N-acetylmannosamine-6-phosphate 2-epimerase [Leptolyngbya boryana CZ1]|uniref:Putative N-acetylmannosamine-6-phosphate 2-epimerase n=1 Tax=Leptolyngbya boryana CZ1 TaxID=3060204 RepID=A0AA96WXY6_LEPBY|nr:putative N-acetylmannosamine-6-phosphate 2-epimerase [Leptolyngbya boryana]WNZ47013.1 putative N-acetylmannosamine-6-phosphate 2-epimerase [Leptolyngbya boryana CZ1]